MGPDRFQPTPHKGVVSFPRKSVVIGLEQRARLAGSQTLAQSQHSLRVRKCRPTLAPSRFVRSKKKLSRRSRVRATSLPLRTRGQGKVSSTSALQRFPAEELCWFRHSWLWRASKREASAQAVSKQHSGSAGRTRSPTPSRKSGSSVPRHSFIPVAVRR